MTQTVKKYYEVGAVSKACLLIEMLSTRKSWELAALSKAVGLPKTTVHRMILTLEDNGYVIQEKQRGEYCLSFKMFSVGSRMLRYSSMVDVARPYCMELLEAVNETVNLCVPFGTDMLVVDRHITTQPLRQDTVIGGTFPMLQSASGKIFLAFAQEAEVRKAVEQVGGDIRVCEKQIASCEAEQGKAVETAAQSREAAEAFFAQHPLLEPLAQERKKGLMTGGRTARAAAQTAEKAQTRLDDALRAYLTSTLEPAQRDYNEHYVCDYPLGLAGVEQYRAQHDSLVRIDLERYAARLEQAQRDCKDRFRKDILFRMKDDIFNARRQFRELNKVMEQLTYGEEVYRFELEPSRDPQLAAFYQVIVDKGNQQMTEGDSLDNLAATADPAYERQVDELMEKIMADVDENTRARQEGRTGGVTLSDYVDYRTYLDYDIKVTNTVSGQQAYLSRVSRDSSGGENQAPFYVAICASLLQIYQKSENSIRLVLLDEAFSKMTSDRIRPMMELFRRLQLQVLLISTVEKSTAIQPYCDITYSIVRHGDANAIAPFYRTGTLADAPEKETEYE